MLFPNNLPMVSPIGALHGEKRVVKKKPPVFHIGFLVLFFYDIIPEFIYAGSSRYFVFLPNQERQHTVYKPIWGFQWQ
jgi:hypothetical protein